MFSESPDFGGETPKLLLAVPEYKVPIPGGTRDSQNDLFALVTCAGQTVSMTVEGKVDERFGPTVAKWLTNPTKGKSVRLAFLQKLLGLPENLPGDVYYQLLHRTASAVIEAGRFKTDAAAMIVHSFSPERMWFDAYAHFLELLGIPETSGEMASIRLPNGLPLYLGWACGDKKFLST